MVRRSGFDSTLVVGYGTLNILEVSSVFKAMCIRNVKVVEPTWKVSVARRSRFNDTLKVGYGMVNILKVSSVSKAT